MFYLSQKSFTGDDLKKMFFDDSLLIPNLLEELWGDSMHVSLSRDKVFFFKYLY